MPIRGNAKKVMKSMKDEDDDKKGKRELHHPVNSQDPMPASPGALITGAVLGTGAGLAPWILSYLLRR